VPAWRKMGQSCLLLKTSGRNVMFLYVTRGIEGNGLNQPKNKILTFRGACNLIYSYNERQRDALFLKFIR